MNKRGEGLGLGTIIGLILGLIVLLLAAYFAYGFFTTAEGYIDKSKIDIPVLTRLCNTEISGDTVTSFCKTPRYIADNYYVNCEFAHNEYGIAMNAPNIPAEGCSDVSVVEMCNGLLGSLGKKYDKTKVSVNGLFCGDILDKGARYSYDPTKKGTVTSGATTVKCSDYTDGNGKKSVERVNCLEDEQAISEYVTITQGMKCCLKK